LPSGAQHGISSGAPLRRKRIGGGGIEEAIFGASYMINFGHYDFPTWQNFIGKTVLTPQP
jgi:hypothetical protein